MISIGIDIGGTWLRVAAVTPDGRIAAQSRTPVAQAGSTFEAFAHRLVLAAREMLTTAHGLEPRVAPPRARGHGVAEDCPRVPACIGIAVPGLIDAARGVVTRSVNLSFLEGASLREILQNELGAPLTMTTDAQACCWAEFQAIRPAPSCFVHLRLGTGVACAMVRKGKVELLDRDGATHPRLLIVEDGDAAKPCPCGLRGCLETVASGRALADVTANSGATVWDSPWRGGLPASASLSGRVAHPSRSDGWGLDDGLRTEELSQTAGLGMGATGGLSASASPLRNDQPSEDPGSRTGNILLDRAAHATVRALHQLAVHYKPAVICLGGGLLDHNPALWSRMEQRYDAERTNAPTLPPLSRARLGDDAGAIGAAQLAVLNLHP